MTMRAEQAPSKNSALPELERPCRSCAGAGWELAGQHRFRCEECGGAGRVVTEVGRRVLDFLSRHLDQVV